MNYGVPKWKIIMQAIKCDIFREMENTMEENYN